MIGPFALTRRPARRLAHHRPALAGGVVLVLLASLALAAPLLASLLGIDPDAVDLLVRSSPPSAAHWLGTDELGRDLLLRLLYGGRVSLGVGIAGAGMAALVGTAVGLASGYLGGPVDTCLMRLTDAVIALPLLPLLIVLAALDLEKAGVASALAQSPAASLYRIVVIVALFGWTTVARLVRGATLSVREREYVLAARATGVGPLRIMIVHILPNVASPLVIAATLSVGNVVLLESVLSFLGLGIQPPVPSWGNMLSNAQELVYAAPRLALYPGALIFVTVLAINLVGDGLQDVLDPRRRRPR